MTFPTEEDIEVFDSSVGFTSGKQFSLEITSVDKQELESLKQQILAEHEIVERLKAFINQSDFESPDDAIDYLHILPKLKSILEKKPQ